MRKMKTMIALLLVLLLFSSCAATQGSSSGGSTSTPAPTTSDAPATDAPATVSWLVNETANLSREQYEAVVNAFETDHPEIQIDLQLVTDLDTTNAYMTMIAGDTLPDVIHSARYIAEIDGVLADVPEWVSEKFKPDFLFQRSDGTINTVPVCSQGVWGVVYHKNIFKEAGIDKTPATWEEFRAVCDTLIGKGKAPIMGWGTTDETFFSMMWIAPTLCNDLHAAYPDFSKQILSGELSWTDPVIANNLKTFQSLSTNGYFYGGSNSLDYGNAVAEFQAGGAAMMIDGVWSLAGLDPEEYGVFILPDESGSNSSTMTTAYWGVNEKAKNKDAAWTFVDWVLCGDGLKIYTDQILSKDSQISCAKDAVPYDMDPLVKDFYDTLDTRDIYVNQFELSGDDALPSGFSEYFYTALARIFFEGVDVDSALTDVESEFKILLEEQK
ncbi:hypothetical protein AGMMS49983_17800 [Clostridia bacterium]|nr:hypothetical protein AGMMS49983_17800 [Clostridia bacterium]